MYYVNFRPHLHNKTPILKAHGHERGGALDLKKEFTQEETLRLLRSRTLSVWEDAPLLREYIHLCGITQSECAVRLGRSQSSVANRLRLLRLTSEERRAMQEAGLSERHARALLRLPEGEPREAALAAVIKRRLSVSETEAYVDAQLRPAEGRELGALLAKTRQLLDEGLCADASESVRPDGLTITLFFPGYGTFP